MQVQDLTAGVLLADRGVAAEQGCVRAVRDECSALTDAQLRFVGSVTGSIATEQAVQLRSRRAP